VEVIHAIGESAAKELYNDIARGAEEVAAAKVDKASYDAHAALIDERFGRVEDKIDSLWDRFDDKLTALSVRFDDKLAALSNRVDDKFAAQEKFFDQRFQNIELKFDRKLSDTKKEIILWTVGLMTAVMGVWAAVMVGLLK